MKQILHGGYIKYANIYVLILSWLIIEQNTAKMSWKTSQWRIIDHTHYTRFYISFYFSFHISHIFQTKKEKTNDVLFVKLIGSVDLINRNWQDKYIPRTTVKGKLFEI